MDLQFTAIQIWHKSYAEIYILENLIQQNLNFYSEDDVVQKARRLAKTHLAGKKYFGCEKPAICKLSMEMDI